MPDNKRKAVLLRMSPELWAALNRWASDELRSVNAQIEYVLREAVRRRVRGPIDDEAGAVFETAYPWVQQLIDELRQRGLADWAQRLEGAIGFGGTANAILANLRANLEELVEGVTALPPEVGSRAAALLRALEGAGLGHPGPCGVTPRVQTRDGGAGVEGPATDAAGGELPNGS